MDEDLNFAVLCARLQRASVIAEIYLAAGNDEGAEGLFIAIEKLIEEIREMAKKKGKISTKVIKSIPAGDNSKNQGTKPSKKSGNKC